MPSPVPDTGAADAIQAAKPAAIKVVGVEVRHAGRPARLLLKPPSTHGLAWIRYGDGGQETEIAAGTIEQVVSVATV
jgi:ParB family chromosome partitioning protein